MKLCIETSLTKVLLKLVPEFSEILLLKSFIQYLTKTFDKIPTCK